MDDHRIRINVRYNVKDKMTLGELLEKMPVICPELQPPFAVMQRTTAPSNIGIQDFLSGYCKWDGENLTPLDGDYYSLDDEIVAYEVFSNIKQNLVLSVTVPGDWEKGESK